MSNFNPDNKIVKSKGIDLPIMYVYLAGRIAGECIDKCTQWRKEIVEHYKNYKPACGDPYDKKHPDLMYESYPISFLDPLNSGEAKSVDAKGLTSLISPNLIYDKDLFSVKKADVIVANLEDYFEEGIEKQLKLNLNDFKNMDLNTIAQHYKNLVYKIENRRENFGTICEVSWALYLQKPLILIVPEKRRDIYERHPFSKRASVIVTSVDELIKGKYLNILYKSMSGAIYE